jgi:hydrogenase nickel incorporation protein HypB
MKLRLSWTKEKSAMRETIRVQVMEEILGENDRLAGEMHRAFDARGVFAVNVLGAPGAGKTTCIIRIIENLKDKNVSVIEGDIESNIDAVRLDKLGIATQQINTQGACHLDAPVISQAADGLSLKDGSLLFIENVGNLVCPAEFYIGEHVKMLVLTAAGGSDKPYKYPLAFEKADVLLLNKCDLLPYVDFDEEYFMRGVRALNKNAPLFKVSGRSGQGFKEAARWLEQRQGAK